jgi:hypothetical protein
MRVVSQRALVWSGLALLFMIAAIEPIRSYDYFWHLATGRWIASHHALPLTDPFALASDRTPWINGEWLCELILYALHSAGGTMLLVAARTIAVGGLFAGAAYSAGRRGNELVALGLAALALAGSHGRLDVRPSTAAALFVAIAVLLLAQTDGDDAGVPRNHLWRDLAYALLTVIWINVHPSALLAPLLACIAMALQMVARRTTGLIDIARRMRIVALSAAALLVNPFGWRAIAAPIELTLFVRGGGFVNSEWLPSPILLFPILYLTFAAAMLAFMQCIRVTPHTVWTRHLWRVALLLLLGALAMQHVRNQGLYFAALPFLAAPLIASVANEKETRALRIVAAGTIAIAAAMLLTGSHTAGIAEQRFPVAAVRRLQASGLRGHIYNPDQFGGFLIWSCYGERRVLTDGRNELYRHYIPEYAAARLDERKWRALLQTYAIDLAVDEYHRERLDVIDACSGAHITMPVSRAYFPIRTWALIAFDDAGLLFARRAAFPPAVLAPLEYRALAPDDAAQRFVSVEQKNAAARELERLRSEIGDAQIVHAIADRFE